MDTMNDWIKGQEALYMLKCSEGKLRKLRNQGMLKWTRIEKTIYYSKASILGLFETADKSAA
jgi:hypothetical protein